MLILVSYFLSAPLMPSMISIYRLVISSWVTDIVFLNILFAKFWLKKYMKGVSLVIFVLRKTMDVLQGYVYWPRLKRDVEHVIHRCVTCQRAKSHTLAQDLYLLLPVPCAPWEDISLEFIIGLPRTQRKSNSIMVVVDRFSKMAHFTPCNTSHDAVQVANLYSRKLYGYMVFPNPWLVIETPSSLVISSEPYGRRWEQSSNSALPAIHKLMSKLRSLIAHWEHYFMSWLIRIFIAGKRCYHKLSLLTTEPHTPLHDSAHLRLFIVSISNHPPWPWCVGYFFSF